MSRKHRKICMTLNYVAQLLILTSSVAGSVSISAFTSLAGTPVGITISAVELIFYAMTARIKKYNSIIEKKKKHDEIVLLTKTELNAIEVLIS